VRIEGTPPRITHRVAIPGEPSRLVANARSVWVIARDHNGSAQWRPTRGTRPALWRIDAKTNEPAALIRLPLTPIRVALGAGSVWVTAMRVLSSSGFSSDATVFRIDPQTNRIVADPAPDARGRRDRRQPRPRVGRDSTDAAVESPAMKLPLTGGCSCGAVR
jgi:hypothetical protein